MLKSAFISALPDADIVGQARDYLQPFSREDGRDGRRSREHVKVIGWQLSALPAQAVGCALQSAASLVSEGMPLHPTELALLCLPLDVWKRTGALDGNASFLGKLLNAASEFLRRGDASRDDFTVRAVLDLLQSAGQAKVLSSQDIEACRESVAGLLSEDRGGPEDAGLLLAAMETYAALDSEWRPSPIQVEGFMKGYAELRRSSAGGMWGNVLANMGKYLDEDRKTTAAKYVEDHVHYTLAGGGHVLGPNPEWAATSVHQAAKHSVLDAATANGFLLSLVDKYPECAPWVLGLKSIEQSVLQTARESMLRADVAGLDQGHTLQRWVDWATDAQSVGPDVERILLAQRFAESSLTRARANYSLGTLAGGIGLSGPALADFVAHLPVAAKMDPSFKVRAAAFGSAAVAFKALPDSLVSDLLEHEDEGAMAPILRQREALRRVADGVQGEDS